VLVVPLLLVVLSGLLFESVLFVITLFPLLLVITTTGAGGLKGLGLVLLFGSAPIAPLPGPVEEEEDEI